MFIDVSRSPRFFLSRRLRALPVGASGRRRGMLRMFTLRPCLCRGRDQFILISKANSSSHCNSVDAIFQRTHINMFNFSFSLQITLVVELFFLFKDAMSKNKLNENEEEGMQNIRWEQELSGDILPVLTRHLSLNDCLQFRAVCSSWRSAISSAIATHNCHHLPEPPIAVLRYSKGIQSEDPCSILGTERLLINSKGPLLYHVHKEKICIGSVEGWLIFIKASMLSFSFSFLNPVTHVEILVPSELSYPSNSPNWGDKLHIKKLAASSKPYCASCFLVALFSDFCHFAFCKISDEYWTMIEAEHGEVFMDVEFLGGKLYVISINKHNNCILVYDELQDSDTKHSLQVSFPGNIPPSTYTLHPGNPNLILIHGVYYYMAKDESLQDLFIVSLHINTFLDRESVALNFASEFISPPEIIKMELFKLCPRNDDENNDRFVKIDSLGDRVLFISAWNHAIASSSTINKTEELIAENSIYFAFHHLCSQDRWKGLQMGVLCLDDNNIEYYSIDDRSSEYYGPPVPTWFIPSLD